MPKAFLALIITLLRLVLRPMLADDEVLLLLGGNVGESHFGKPKKNWRELLAP